MGYNKIGNTFNDIATWATKPIFYRRFDRPKYSEKTDRKMSVAAPRVVKLSSELVFVEKW